MEAHTSRLSDKWEHFTCETWPFNLGDYCMTHNLSNHSLQHALIGGYVGCGSSRASLTEPIESSSRIMAVLLSTRPCIPSLGYFIREIVEADVKTKCHLSPCPPWERPIDFNIHDKLLKAKHKERRVYFDAQHYRVATAPRARKSMLQITDAARVTKYPKRQVRSK